MLTKMSGKGGAKAKFLGGFCEILEHIVHNVECVGGSACVGMEVHFV